MPANAMNSDTLPPVRLAGDSTATRITIRDGRIQALEQCDLPSQHLCLPAFQDLHLHANRAFSLVGKPPESFDDAANIAVASFGQWTREDYRRSSRQLFDRCLGFGTAKVRSHADIDPDSLLDAVEGTLDASREVSATMEVQVVAFASGRVDPRDRSCQSLFERAVASGATHIGGVPNFYDRPDQVIEIFLELARALGVDLDLHLDEHLDPSRCFSEHLAKATGASRMQGRVSLSHACAISTMPVEARNRTVEAIAANGIDVIALPATNLYLQDRTSSFPSLRGITPIRELLAAGANVRIASDNIQDCFYPYGSGDMVDVIALTVTAAQIDDEVTIAKLACGGRHRPEIGDPAQLVLFPDEGIRAALGDRGIERTLVGFSCD